MFREESILARAKQVLGVEEGSEALIRKNFRLCIVKFHPDKKGAHFKEQAEVLLEAYHVLLSKIKPLECKLLEQDDLVASLLPEGVKPVKLGKKYSDWLKQQFYDFVKP